jgi:hypothetical protein
MQVQTRTGETLTFPNGPPDFSKDTTRAAPIGMGDDHIDYQDWPHSSLKNWVKVAATTRSRLCSHLRSEMLVTTAGRELFDTWVKQKAAGDVIGSDDICFHFGPGVSVRNCLRDALRDDELPEIKYPHDISARNWDDFYYGCIDEMCGQELAEHGLHISGEVEA